MLMTVFLCGSAYCSGTETAFFSLTRRQIRSMRQSRHRLHRLVARLLDRPGNLLGSLLLGNLIINILYFAASSVLMMQMKLQFGWGVAAGIGVFTFLCLILLGEILPKSMAYAAPERVCLWLVVPTFLLVRILSPLVAVFRVALVEPTLRLLLGPARHPHSISSDELKTLIEDTRRRGLISRYQGRLFTEAVDFSLLRVRHVMRPRVDILACGVHQGVAAAQALMLNHQVTGMCVFGNGLDDVLGEVHLRDCLLQPDASLSSLLHPVYFVPEQKTVESLLQFFRKMRTDAVMVVDEYGGIAGTVHIEDLAEELVGPLHSHDDTAEIQQLGPFAYRLPGDLPIHDWTQVLGLQPGELEVATLGGWITGLLGRIPRQGDKTSWGSLEFQVETMLRHRVETVVLRIGPSHD